MLIPDKGNGDTRGYADIIKNRQEIGPFYLFFYFFLGLCGETESEMVGHREEYRHKESYSTHRVLGDKNKDGHGRPEEQMGQHVHGLLRGDVLLIVEEDGHI